MTYTEMPEIKSDDLSMTARDISNKNETGYTFALPYGRGHKIYTWEDAPSDDAWDIQARLATLAKNGWRIVVD